MELKTGVELGRDVSIEDLAGRGSRRSCSATGAHKSRKLGVEGEEAEGVITRGRFPSPSEPRREGALGQSVAIIGGGNVAIDSARTAVGWAGRSPSSTAARRDEMPANSWEIEEAEEEGVEFHYLCAPEILAEGGKVTAVECMRMVLGEPDASGRRSPVPVSGSEFVIPVDTLIPAVSQVPSTSYAGGRPA